MRFRNAGPDSLEIRAEGGAGSVVVDTLAPGDSSGAYLETRADSVTLSAYDGSGSAVGDGHVVRAADPPRRVAFP